MFAHARGKVFISSAKCCPPSILIWVDRQTLQESVKIKFRGTREDVEEVLKVVLESLYKKFVVTPTSRYRVNEDKEGVHIFYKIRSFPKSILEETGREW